MNNYFFIILATVLLYLLFFVIKVRRYDKNEKVNHRSSLPEEIKAIEEKFTSKGTLEKEEAQITSKADQVLARVELLKAYFFVYGDLLHSDRPKKYVEWLAQHVPDAKVPWFEFTPFFLMDKSEGQKIVDLFQAAIRKSPEKLIILENAAMFSGPIDDKFTIECLETLVRKKPLNPVWRENLAFRFLLGRDVTNSAEQAAKISKLYEDRLAMPWTESAYLGVESIRSGFLGWLYPLFVAKWLLKNMCKLRLIESDINWYTLSCALAAAIDGKRYKVADSLYKEIENRNVDQEYKPSLDMMYASMVRYTLLRERKNELEKWLKVWTSDQDSEPRILGYDEEQFIIELSKSKDYKDLLKTYFERRRFDEFSEEKIRHIKNQD